MIANCAIKMLNRKFLIRNSLSRLLENPKEENAFSRDFYGNVFRCFTERLALPSPKSAYTPWEFEGVYAHCEKC